MATYVMDSPSVSDVRVKTDAAFPAVLAVLFALVYAQGYLERVGIPSHIVKMTVEIPVFMIMMHLINRGVPQLPPGSILIALYVVWTVISAIFNADGLSMSFLYCRYVVYAYIVFAAVWSTPLTKTAVARLNLILSLLFIVQILASAHEVFVLGERVEAHVGALYADGGSLATEFPLLAMALTVPFYLYYRQSSWVLVLAWAFFFVGYASGKRAIYFLGPPLYFLMLSWHVIRNRTLCALKQSLYGVTVFACLVPLILLGISRSHGLGSGNTERSSERVTQAIRAAVDYTTAETKAGQTTGRTATNRRVLSTLLEGKLEVNLFGWGPAAMREGEKRYQDLLIGYGICGWAQDVICIGWPGMAIYLLFHLRMFFCLRSGALPRHSGYWMAIRFGAEIAFFVILASYIAYSSSFITGGQLSYVYFYFLALLVSPQHRHVIQGTR